MNRKTVWLCIATLLLVAYFGVALTFAARARTADTMGSLEVRLTDPANRFVSVADVVHECALDPDSLNRTLRSDFDLYSLSRKLKASDKIQNAQVNILSDGTLSVVVEPMVPVARVFDSRQPSYYINATGKRISAELRYHIDVPVLLGTFDSVHPASRLLPLLDYIASNPKISAMVATVMQESDGNIILVPNIVGHVVNFGDTSLVADKFKRLRNFYRHVAPTRGWEMYDTIAVKWRDQVVATRRHKELAPVALPTSEEQSGIFDIDDDENLAHPETLEEGVESRKANT